MVRLRVLSAAIGLPLASFLVFIGGLPFAVAVSVVALVGLWELIQKFERKGIRIVKEVAFPCVVSAVLGSYWTPPSHYLSLLVAIWWVGILGSMVFHIFQTKEETSEARGERAVSIAATFFSIAYLSLFAMLVLLRNFEVSISDRVYPFGRDLVFLVLMSVWVTDAAAFFFGRTLGRQPLAPQVSPGKTLEGSVSGTVSGLVAAWLFVWMFISFGSETASQVWLAFARPIPFTLLALALGTVGQIGDLGKSVLKRSLGVKDFGSIIPGHGGVLDRFDSLLATAPLVYLYAYWLVR